jgi:hypothetical protein
MTMTYYIADSQTALVRIVTDDGSSLTESATVSPSLTAVTRLAFDSDKNIIAVYYAGSTIRLTRLNASTLAVIQINGADYVSVSGAVTAQGRLTITI